MPDFLKLAEIMGQQIKASLEPLQIKLDAQQKELDALRAENAKLRDQMPTQVDIASIAKEAAALVPVPTDGKDADMVEVKSHIAGLVSSLPAPKDGKDGVDGKDADMAELKLHLVELVKHVQLPSPPSADEVAAVFERRFSDLTLSWERQARDTFERAADRIPVPKDGRDALPLESFDLRLENDGRTVTVKMQAGDTELEKSVRIASVIDCGQFRHDGKYEKGDGVSHGGCFWIAQKDSPEGAPGMGKSDWRLAVKKGRDGKDLRDNASTHDSAKGLKI